jgi:multidrug resistance protein, MATE family
METAGSINNLKVGIHNKQILSIALPITLAMLIPQANMLANSIFLGQLSTEALGNAGITGVFYLIFAVAGNGLNNALQTVFSRSAGSGQSRTFGIIFTQGIRISLQFAAVCILFTWLIAPFIMKAVADPVAYPIEMSYLKIRIFGLPFLFLFQLGNAFLVSSLNTKWLMVGFLFETSVNIVFDYLLIFGKAGFPQLGFNGAAVASVMAEATGMLVVWGVLVYTGLKKKYGLLSQLRFNRIYNKEVLKVATPLVTQYALSVTTWLIFFLLIESKGTMAKAISNVMRNVIGIAGIFIWAFGSTTSSMVSNLTGQKRTDLVIPLAKRITMWSVGLCAILCALLNIFPVMFFRLFGQDELFVSAATPVIRVVSVGLILMSIAMVWLNTVTGTGKTRVNLGIELIAISLYLVYTWFFMKAHYVSLAVAWTNEFIYWTSIFLMSALYIYSYRWVKGDKILKKP